VATIHWCGRKFHPALGGVILLAALLCLMAACNRVETPQIETPAPPAPTRTRLVIVPSWTPTLSPSPTPVPSSTITLTPAPTATPTLSPTPRLLPALEPVIELSADQLADPANQVLHDLILFTSDSANPFPSQMISLAGTQNIQYQPQVWAISPDGSHAGRLTPGDKSFAAYFPADPTARPLFVAYGVYFNHPAIQSIQLPGECYGRYLISEAEIVTTMGDQPCNAFQFSADGQILGFFFGPQICGQGVILLDTQSGDKPLRTGLGSNHGFEFLPTNKMLLATGHCEGGEVSLLDLASQALTPLGAEGFNSWNADHSVLVVWSMPYSGAESVLWGYNVTTDQLFMPEPETWQRDDHLLWAPDGQTFLYQHRTFTRNDDPWTYDFNSPRQIMRVDPQTGQQTVLAGDPGYDYDLCAGSNNDCDTWYGDWVQVRRFPFQPQTIAFDDNFFSKPAATCLLYGTGCSSQPDLFALNWQTGELVAWENVPLPTATPTSSALTSTLESTVTPTPGPDLSLPPVYAHPLGAYAFYVGLDGHSLWLVPAEGQPELWVEDGSHFMYLP
jgi:hypothetical protein